MGERIPKTYPGLYKGIACYAFSFGGWSSPPPSSNTTLGSHACSGIWWLHSGRAVTGMGIPAIIDLILSACSEKSSKR